MLEVFHYLDFPSATILKRQLEKAFGEEGCQCIVMTKLELL